MIRLLAGAFAVFVVTIAAVSAQTAPPPPKPPAASAAAPLNLNTATLAQLETLPGIGMKVAERIVEYRQKNGGFKKVEELMNIRGIGEKSFLKLKAMITVPPAKTDRASQ
jgi:competence protein ComEA